MNKGVVAAAVGVVSRGGVVALELTLSERSIIIASSLRNLSSTVSGLSSIVENK